MFTFLLTEAGGHLLQEDLGRIILQEIPDSSGSGGHFIPLTQKQLRDLRKKERKEREAIEAREQARKEDADSIGQSIRASLNPKAAGIPPTVIPTESPVDNETDEDEDDIAFLLLHS